MRGNEKNYFETKKTRKHLTCVRNNKKIENNVKITQKLETRNANKNPKQKWPSGWSATWHRLRARPPARNLIEKKRLRSCSISHSIFLVPFFAVTPFSSLTHSIPQSINYKISLIFLSTLTQQQKTIHDSRFKKPFSTCAKTKNKTKSTTPKTKRKHDP